MSHIEFGNETLKLSFEAATGALIGLTAVETGWEILNRPTLGLNFRLMLPLPGRRNNPVFGERQPVSAVDTTADSVTFYWDHVTSRYGGIHDIRMRLNVRLNQRQAIFQLTAENHSANTIEAVYCPYLGDVQHPDQTDFKSFVYHYASAVEWPIWPTFQNMRGYYGVDYPTQFSQWTPGVGAPMAPFILLRIATQGLYVGVATADNELVAWHAELRPGWDSSLTSHVSTGPALSGKDVATRFAAVHLPYILPGQTRTLTPVALEAFQGDWQHGVNIYRQWRTSWLRPPVVPSWAREPHAWQQLHINSPEDELRMPFSELPQIGEDCTRHGVKAIQLVGWNAGGQDQGNPSHSPDPRLGTPDELCTAITTIQSMGVKVILFAKFTWADRATEWFRNDLIKQAIKDPYGDYYHYPGYQYQTATQLLDINTKRLIPMCFLSEAYLKVCESEFQKVLDLGADGILFDECLHHGPALLCFDESHGHRPGAMVCANDNELIRRLGRMAAGANPDFLFAGEACYDREFETYHVSYHRSENPQHIPLSRYLAPHAQLMTAVTGFNDRK